MADSQRQISSKYVFQCRGSTANCNASNIQRAFYNQQSMSVFVDNFYWNCISPWIDSEIGRYHQRVCTLNRAEQMHQAQNATSFQKKKMHISRGIVRHHQHARSFNRQWHDWCAEPSSLYHELCALNMERRTIKASPVCRAYGGLKLQDKLVHVNLWLKSHWPRTYRPSWKKERKKMQVWREKQ